jgi:hypothetical protein
MAWVVVSMAVAGTARPKTAETEGAGSRRPFSSGLVKPARLERDVKRALVGAAPGLSREVFPRGYGDGETGVRNSLTAIANACVSFLNIRS